MIPRFRPAGFAVAPQAPNAPLAVAFSFLRVCLSLLVSLPRTPSPSGYSSLPPHCARLFRGLISVSSCFALLCLVTPGRTDFSEDKTRIQPFRSLPVVSRFSTCMLVRFYAAASLIPRPTPSIPRRSSCTDLVYRRIQDQAP